MADSVLRRVYWVTLWWGIGMEGVLRMQFQGEEWDRMMGANCGMENLGVV